MTTTTKSLTRAYLTIRGAARIGKPDKGGFRVYFDYMNDAGVAENVYSDATGGHRVCSFLSTVGDDASLEIR